MATNVDSSFPLNCCQHYSQPPRLICTLPYLFSLLLVMLSRLLFLHTSIPIHVNHVQPVRKETFEQDRALQKTN